MRKKTNPPPFFFAYTQTSESKFLVELLQRHKRVILTSDSVRYSKPVHLFPLAQTITPALFSDFDLYAKRYCDAKATVFGFNYEGESNKTELSYLLDSNVWYAPKSEQLKPGFPEFDCQEVIFSIKKSKALKCQVEEIISISNNCKIVDEERLEILASIFFLYCTYTCM